MSMGQNSRTSLEEMLATEPDSPLYTYNCGVVYVCVWSLSRR